MKVTLVKHGKTKYNVEGRRQGKTTNLSLCEVGKQEIIKLKNEIANEFDICISSPLKRAYETAQLIYSDKKIIKNHLLSEYDFGELEGIPFSMPVERFPNNRIEVYNGIEFLIPNKGESFNNLVKRCEKFISYLKKNFEKNSNILIITHGTNFEILKALFENKKWHTYLGQVNKFNGFCSLNLVILKDENNSNSARKNNIQH